MATLLIAAGQIQQGREAAAEGRSAFKIGLFNQAVQEREAQAIEQKAAFEGVRQAKAGRRIRGALRTQLATSGAELGTGVTASLEAEQIAELELENALIGFEARKGAKRARRKGELDVIAGKQAKRRGRAAKRASFIKAGGTLLTGFATAGVGPSPVPANDPLALALT